MQNNSQNFSNEQKGHLMMKTIWNNAALMIIPAIVIFLTACSTGHDESQAGKIAPIEVTVAKPESSGSAGITASGQVTSATTAAVSTRIMGYITRIMVKAGDRVRKGQVLATISSEDITAKRAQADAMIAEASAAWKNAEKDYERFNALYNQQSASAKEVETISFQYASAKSRLAAARQVRREAEAMLSYATIRAPFDGVVTGKPADEGNMASPGMPLLTIEQPGQLQVTAAIAESDIDKIRTGQTARLNISAAGKSFTGKVTEVNPSSSATGGQYLIRIEIPGKEKSGLHSGMFVNVFIPGKSASPLSEETVWVPQQSIVRSGQLYGIYTPGSDNRALLRWVRTGKQSAEKVEILAGLSKNETYITRAEGRLYNGAPVTIKK